jgi:uncharacterized integral membrane protein (TIGR00697 family)
MGRYRYLDLLTVLTVVIILVSDVTAPKLFAICGVQLSVTVLYFPLSCVLADIITEVYGYAAARRATWCAVISSVVACSMYQAILMLPGTDGPAQQLAYSHVLSSLPRTLVGGWLALWSGMLLNNYVMARLKVCTGGRHFWFRALASTVVGEFANTALFYSVALSGTIPSHSLVVAITWATALKITSELVTLPITYQIVGTLKRLELSDPIDRGVDFNPFILNVERSEQI